MTFKRPSLKTLRILTIAGAVLATAFGFFCLTEWPGKTIFYFNLSQDELLNVETVAAIQLAGVFFSITGWTALTIGLFWPGVIAYAAAQPRREFLYGVSLFGTNILLFFGLALGRQSFETYRLTLIIVFAGILLFFLEWRFSRYIAAFFRVAFCRWLAYPGYIAAGMYFFSLRFPFDTFKRYLFSRDYPMFQYTALLDWKILKQGWLYGWEPSFSGGYPTFLNLRSILIPYAPFLFLEPALAFHIMIFTVYLAVPFLVYWVAKEISGDRDVAIMSGWAGMGLMTGYMWHILNWGMAPTFTSLPFMLLALGFLVRAMKGSRWGTFLSALFWTPLAYIHLGHFAHAAIILFIITLVYTFERKSLEAFWNLTWTTILTVLMAAPYLAMFMKYRSHVILTNFYSYPSETLEGMARQFLRTVSRFIPTLQWDWRGLFNSNNFPDYLYLSLATLFSLVIAYLLFGRNREDRRAGVLYAGVIVVSALSFVPKFQLSFQRMLYFVPPIMALGLGAWLGAAKKKGRALPLYVLIVLLVFYTRYWQHYRNPLPTIAGRGDFDPSVVEKIKELPGNVILFENTASLDPHEELGGNFEKVPEEWDVHGPGFLYMETGKRFLSHPGYNPHPYYDLRGTYIASGTYLGQDLDTYEPEFFRELFRKWGVEYLVLWHKHSIGYFGSDTHYEKVLEGERYTVYRFLTADGRSVATMSGSGNVEYPDNFHSKVTLKGVEAGSRVVVRANYFPEWTAVCEGEEVAIVSEDGQIAFDAPAPDCTVTLTFPQYRWLFAVAAFGLLAGVLLSVVRKPRVIHFSSD